MRSIGTTYLLIAAILAAYAWMLVEIVGGAHAASPATARMLLQPVVTLVGITAAVWIVMTLWRNVAVIRGMATLRYFRAYTSDAPAEWVERPARAYMNLLELPMLFYVACALMLATGRFDAGQVALAWVFVATRGVHALIHIATNYVPLRFAAFAAGSVTLGILWVRFAAQNL